MSADGVKISGNKDDLDQLKRDLGADLESVISNTTELRPRQFGIEEAIVAVVIHIPAGMTAHFLYDWIKNWRARTGKNVQAEAVDKSSN